jgi:hypothetical protein
MDKGREIINDERQQTKKCDMKGKRLGARADFDLDPCLIEKKKLFQISKKF